jgi:acetolactate synthase-1/3 small subunit
MGKVVLSLLVENSAGVLSRVAGLFSRRGYNIDSLTVGETQNPQLSRMTIVSSGDEEELEQIGKQVGKLVDVVAVKELPSNESVYRELMLIKVEVSREERQQVIALANIFRAKIIDVADTSVIIEVTGDVSKEDAFLSLLENYNILQVARTGITGLSRGAYDMT